MDCALFKAAESSCALEPLADDLDDCGNCLWFQWGFWCCLVFCLFFLLAKLFIGLQGYLAKEHKQTLDFFFLILKFPFILHWVIVKAKFVFGFIMGCVNIYNRFFFPECFGLADFERNWLHRDGSAKRTRWSCPKAVWAKPLCSPVWQGDLVVRSQPQRHVSKR